jgi:hypothetical protein
MFLQPKDMWVVCINDQGYNQHPQFPLQQGEAYLVFEIRKAPSLFTNNSTKYVFVGNDGETKVEISAIRFKKMADDLV